MSHAIERTYRAASMPDFGAYVGNAAIMAFLVFFYYLPWYRVNLDLLYLSSMYWDIHFLMNNRVVTDVGCWWEHLVYMVHLSSCDYRPTIMCSTYFM